MGLRPHDSFQRARLDPFSLVGEVAAVDEAEGDSSEQQRAALAACCAPGLQVVWSPQGKATTEVLVGAIQRIVGQGQRVLLVSPTDSAVAEAVAAVIANGSYDVGAVVRIGASVLPEARQAGETGETGRASSLTLAELVDLRRKQLAEEVKACGELIAELRQAPVFDQLIEAQEEARTKEFDAGSYRAAVDRSRNAHHLEFCQALRDETRLDHEHNLGQLRQARRRALPVQLRYEQARLRRAYGAILLADMRLSAVEDGTPFAPLRRRGDRAAARAALAEARQEWLAADRRIKELHEELSELGVGAGSTLVRSELTRPVSQAELEREMLSAADELAPVQETLDVATRRSEAAAARLAEAQRELDEAKARPQPLPEDGDSFEEAGQAGLPELYRRIGRMRDEVAETQERIEAGTERLHDLERQQQRQHREVERSVLSDAKVVATTLSMLALRQAVRKQTFDHVIVGDAPAADLPLVAYALGRATIGAVLIGSYESAAGSHASARRRLGSDCFNHLGLHRPDLASGAEGCVVLTD